MRTLWSHCRLAEAFTKPRFFEPLLQNTDPLPGLHANTHLAQVSSCFGVTWASCVLMIMMSSILMFQQCVCR